MDANGESAQSYKVRVRLPGVHLPLELIEETCNWYSHWYYGYQKYMKNVVSAITKNFREVSQAY